MILINSSSSDAANGFSKQKPAEHEYGHRTSRRLAVLYPLKCRKQRRAANHAIKFINLLLYHITFLNIL